jgi:hypothetical protein
MPHCFNFSIGFLFHPTCHIIMRIITCLLLFLFAYTQAQSAPDTTKTSSVRDTTIKQPAKQTAPPATAVDSAKAAASQKDTAAKPNLDSLSMVKDLEYQRQHPEYLYAKKRNHFWPSAVLSLFLVVGLGLYLLFATPLCRDESYDPLTNKLRPIKERPFSYARLQLFWWTIIIFWCFSSFFFYTGVLLAFTSTVVMLLGGGLAVSIFGKVMDSAQIADNNRSVPTRHQDLKGTQGLLTDILSDESGISIHRFQALLANIIFGIGFLNIFLKTLGIAYPLADFEQWQLTLLGVSAAGYLGLKANENSKSSLTDRQVEAVAAIPPAAIVAPPANVSPTAIQLKTDLMAKGVI